MGPVMVAELEADLGEVWLEFGTDHDTNTSGTFTDVNPETRRPARRRRSGGSQRNQLAYGDCSFIPIRSAVRSATRRSSSRLRVATASAATRRPLPASSSAGRAR